MSTRSRLRNTNGGLLDRGNDTGLNEPHWGAEGSWSHTYPMLSAMIVAEQAGVRMMKEYFEIEASESTPQYGFRKGLKLSGDEGYQAARTNSRSTYLKEDVLTCYLGRTLRGIIENKH